MSDAVDQIELTRTVIFVGDYFTLMTTVVLTEELRYEDEIDEDFAVRLATVLMEEYYGWDVADKANEIGVMDDSYEEDEDADD
jgi:hypothetical protein